MAASPTKEKEQMIYHRLPSARNGLRRLYRWLTEPSDQHTVLGRCGCNVCAYNRHVDRRVGR